MHKINVLLLLVTVLVVIAFVLTVLIINLLTMHPVTDSAPIQEESKALPVKQYIDCWQEGVTNDVQATDKDGHPLIKGEKYCLVTPADYFDF